MPAKLSDSPKPTMMATTTKTKPGIASSSALGVLLLASGHSLGSAARLGLIPLVGAVLLFWTGSRLQHAVQS